jgi:hypothetical protein
VRIESEAAHDEDVDPTPRTASLAASFTRSGPTVPYSGPMQIAARFCVPSFSAQQPEPACAHRPDGASFVRASFRGNLNLVGCLETLALKPS